MKDYHVVIAYLDREGKKAIAANSNSDLDIKLTATADRITVAVTPKRKISFLGASAVVPNGATAADKFFANGYQAWSVSKEFGINDRQRGLSFLTKLPLIKKYAMTPGDYMFHDYKGKKGAFRSYSYTYIKKPGGNIQFYGSLNEAFAFTAIDFDFNAKGISFNADLEGLVADKPFVAIDMVQYAGDYDDCFDKYFAALKTPKPRLKGLSGYTSWYNYFQKINEDIILRDLTGLESAGDTANIFQIDDGYQTFVGDFCEVNQTKFPRGMKFIADEIHKRGLLAGLWMAPFVAETKSRTCKEHPDWLIKGKNGKPLLACVGWSKAYPLNFDIPECREYIKSILSNAVNNWGYDMLKLDFLYAVCMYPRDGKTRGMLMREAMLLCREAVGAKPYLLGCGVPLASTFGIVDACRISCDVDLKFKFRPLYKLINNEIISAENAMNNSIFRRHLSGRAFANDPDVFFLRDENLTFTEEQKLILARINNMFGDVLFVSDNVGAYSEDKVKILRDMFTKKDIKILSCDDLGNHKVQVRYLNGGKEITDVFAIN